MEALVMSPEDRMRNHLSLLYGWKASESVWNELKEKLDRFMVAYPELSDPSKTQALTQKDAMLITYGDQVREPGRHPLATLGDFLRTHLGYLVPDVHLLPFYPFSSDDGFSVIDYLQVNPELGTWQDIIDLGRDFSLMFDGVINHISRKNEWFQGFLRGEEVFQDYFIVLEPETDLSQVFRPRALPLLTPVETARGTQYVWTTFSDDQIDLNFANPQVLLNILDILLFYVAHKASFLRLDAIAYLWKIAGTSCIHLPQTHAAIKLLRAMLDLVAPGLVLITETNVPHQENISYFGNGRDEAQLVYNFALPPLVLHSFHTGDARALSSWASSLELPSDRATFFNFLASHDGIGITPARGILSQAEMDALVRRVQEHHGFISYRNLADGSKIPYEMNINFFDALSNPTSGEGLEIQIDRFVTAHAIMFGMIGVPGIYFHSLFGSRSWVDGVAKTGMKRTINRQKFFRKVLDRELADPSLPRAQVLDRLKALLKARSLHQAFGPYSQQRILDLHPSVFAILRGDSWIGQAVCLQNVSQDSLAIHLDLSSLGKRCAMDMLSGSSYQGSDISLQLGPYQTIWIDLLES
jgi:sucrose phosphorylase